MQIQIDEVLSRGQAPMMVFRCTGDREGMQVLVGIARAIGCRAKARHSSKHGWRVDVFRRLGNALIPEQTVLATVDAVLGLP